MNKATITAQALVTSTVACFMITMSGCAAEPPINGVEATVESVETGDDRGAVQVHLEFSYPFQVSTPRGGMALAFAKPGTSRYFLDVTISAERVECETGETMKTLFHLGQGSNHGVRVTGTENASCLPDGPPLTVDLVSGTYPVTRALHVGTLTGQPVELAFKRVLTHEEQLEARRARQKS